MKVDIERNNLQSPELIFTVKNVDIYPVYFFEATG